MIFPAVAAAQMSWPGETWDASTDLTPLNPSGWASNLSGAYWNPATRRLWVCTNGPAKFWPLAEDGAGGFLLEREYTGTGDLEGITQIDTAADRVFLLDEAARRIRAYKVSDGAAAEEWFLGDIPPTLNSGPEGIAFVPNAWLAANNFADGGGNPYPQSVHGANGYGGLVFIAAQFDGWVYAFDLLRDGTQTFVGRYLTSREESCEMTFDPSTGRMHILHNINGNKLEVTDLSSSPSGADRRFNTHMEVQVPSTGNIEGFALTPALYPAPLIGDNWCFFTDDSNSNGALRWFKMLSPVLKKQAGDAQTAGVGAAVPVVPSVLATDVFTSPLPNFPITFTVTAGAGSVANGTTATGANGIAAPGSWRMGPVPGVNTLQAAGAGLSGSPLTFTATGLDVTPPSLTISRAAGQADPVNTLPLVFNAVFSEAVTGFDAADVTQSGSAAGVVFTVTPVDGSHYTITATAAAVDGTVRPAVAAGRCVDDAGNGNTASGGADGTVVLDRRAPTAFVLLDTASPTTDGTAVFTVVFNEPVIPAFSGADVSLSGTLAGAAGAVVSGASPYYTVTVTMNDGGDDGTVGVVLNAGLKDAAGNVFAGAASPLCVIHNWFGFTATPAPAYLYEGTDATLSVAALHGNSTPHYQWYHDAGVNSLPESVGGDEPFLELENAVSVMQGDYWCEVAYNENTYATSPATVRVAPHLSITDPEGATKTIRESHVFMITATGGFEPLTFVWKKDGLAISGAPDQPYLALENLLPRDGGLYSVEVRDAGTDLMVSGEALLEVMNQAPAANALGLALLAALLAVVGRKGAVISRRP